MKIKTIFLALLLLLPLVFGTSHPLLITLQTEPANPVVGQPFTIRVLLNVDSGPALGSDLVSAKLVFRKDSTTFNFQATGSTDSAIFTALERNQLVAGKWVMEGPANDLETGTVTSAPQLLGEISATALTAGTAQLSLTGASAAVEAPGTPPFFADKIEYPLQPTSFSFTIQEEGAAQCTGAVPNPSNSALCADDENSVPADTVRHTVSSCGADKCEYQCNEGLQPNQDGTDCEELPPPPPSDIFTISSAAVASGAFNDEMYGCYQSGVPVGGGVSPPLTISNLPAGTQSLVLLMDDPDAPADPGPTPFSHWVVWDIAPPSSGNTLTIDSNTIPGTQGVNDFDSDGVNLNDVGYGGMCPPAAVPAHNYRIRVYALDVANLNDASTSDSTSDVTAEQSSKADVLTALGVTDGQISGFTSPVVGFASLTGTYPPVVVVQGGDCGDGVIDQGETCDDGNTETETACAYGTATCELCDAGCNTVLNLQGPYCGDGTTNGPEGCDNGKHCSGGQSCTLDSQCTGIGDELCLPRNGDGCSSSCTTEIPGDADSDGIPDAQDQCPATPPGFTVADNNIYTTGDLAGCIIGDIDLNQLFNSNDISAFIFEYNHRDDGFVAAADLTQDTALNSNDISTFIFSYNHRP